jgi:hypothetical protein
MIVYLSYMINGDVGKGVDEWVYYSLPIIQFA